VIHSIFHHLSLPKFDPTPPGNVMEGSLEVKLLTIWTDEKQRWAESERREE
jgi:hypothetical protein